MEELLYHWQEELYGPAAKRIGRELLVQGAPELVEVATKRKSAKQALKSTVAKTARKQFGGSLHSRVTRGRQVIKRRGQQFAKKRSPKKSFLENHSQEEVDWIFSLESKMRTIIVIPSEATHSSLDLLKNHLC